MVCSQDMKGYENIELDSKIFIEDETYHELLSIISEKNKKTETGGIIIGYYDVRYKNAIITECTRAPEDSRATRCKFYRGIKGLKKILQKRWKERNEYYLGEWHLHPGSSPSPSCSDIKQMKKIVNDNNFNCKEPILMILGEVDNIQIINLMLFKNSQVFYYIESRYGVD